MTRLLQKDNEITVRVTATGEPLTLKWLGEVFHVCHIFNAWRINTEWWLETPLIRDYYQVGTREGLIVDIYRDAARDGQWFIERVWD